MRCSEVPFAEGCLRDSKSNRVAYEFCTPSRRNPNFVIIIGTSVHINVKKGVEVAEVQFVEDEIVLHLTRLEHLEAVHGDLRVALSSVSSVVVLDDAHEPADHGFKVGERLPGVSEVASIDTGGTRIFAAVHHDTPRGVRIALESGRFDAWIVGSADPEALAAEIESRLRRRA